jgi:hypothetical protein
MPVPTSLSDLSTTASSNSPAGNESARGTIDDYFRAHAKFIADLNAAKASLTGTETLTNKTLTSPTVNAATIAGGTINNAAIGGTTAAAGAFTTLAASSTATLNTLASSGATITGGTINNASVGATTASTGAFTTLASSSTTTLNGTTIPASKTLVDTDSSQTLTSKTLTSPTLTTPTINSAQVETVSGSAPLYMARAWVSFNSSGTVRSSGNISSVSHSGSGTATVNFSTSMPDANYAVVLGGGGNSGNTRYPFFTVASRSTSSVAVGNGNDIGSGIDVVVLC